MPAFLRSASSRHTNHVLAACMLLIIVFLSGCSSGDVVINQVGTAVPSLTMVRLPNVTPLPSATITPTRTATQAVEEGSGFTATSEPSATVQATATTDARVLSDQEVAQAVEALRPLILTGMFNKETGVWNMPGYSTGTIEQLSLKAGDKTYPVDVLWTYVSKGSEVFRFPLPVGYIIPTDNASTDYFGFNGKWPVYPNWLYIAGVDRDSYLKNASQGPAAFTRARTIEIVSLSGWLYGEAGDPDWSQCELVLTRNHTITHPCELGRELDKAYPGANRAFVRGEYDKLPEGFIPWGWYLQVSR